MTKDNFLWCVRQMAQPSLQTERVGDGWTSAYCVRIVCVGGNAPRRCLLGRPIGTRWANRFVVQAFQGGNNIAFARNEAADARCAAALKKYGRWLAEAPREKGDGHV